MSQEDWVLFFAEAVRRGQRASKEASVRMSSDREWVMRAHRAALDQGEPEHRAWSAAVGAYLERHPDTPLFTAERLVACFMRPDDRVPSPRAAAEPS